MDLFRWWRETRVRRAARMIVAALSDAAAGHLRDYLRAVPSFTLFFVPEGLAFIDYVAALPVPELVHSVGRFERAMWLARFEPQRPPTVIEFAAPPDLVLGAALQGQPLPAPSAELHFIVVDPGVAGH